jgi:hypothetical protein
MSLDQTADTHPFSCIILNGHCFVLSMVDILFEEPHGLKWMDRSGWIEVDRNGSNWIKMDRNGSKWIEMDRNGSKWIKMEWHAIKID